MRVIGKTKFVGDPKDFLSLKTRADVAALLGIRRRFLSWILYIHKEREKYVIFKIPKKCGGFREISSPPKNLAILQKKLAAILLANYRTKSAVHGFVSKRSIATNAHRHEYQRVVFNVDLADFFPTIHLGRFRKLLMAPPFSIGNGAATTIAQICFGTSGKLPQGAPSSPIVSNYVCRSLDDALQELASAHACRYTRYADDITFSTSRPSMPDGIAELDAETGGVSAGKELQEIIESQGFRVNMRKVRLSAFDRRQEVTGLTVNEGANVRRLFVREIDSMIQCWRKHGYTAACREYLKKRGMPPVDEKTNPQFFIRLLRGKLAFLSMVKGNNDAVCRRLRWHLHDNDPKEFPPPPKLKDERPKTLCRFSGRFGGWQKIVGRYLNSVKYIKILREGEIETAASGYVIAPNLLVTAGHVAARKTLRVGFEPDEFEPKKILYVAEDYRQDWGLLYFDGEPFKGDNPFNFQYRLPEIGEEVVAIGFPRIPNRDTTVVVHSGTVEALPVGYHGDVFIQTSFQSGGGLSGGPLVDKRGFVLGLMIENVFMEKSDDRVPQRAYGQATPHEYVVRARAAISSGRLASSSIGPLDI